MVVGESMSLGVWYYGRTKKKKRLECNLGSSSGHSTSNFCIRLKVVGKGRGGDRKLRFGDT